LLWEFRYAICPGGNLRDIVRDCAVGADEWVHGHGSPSSTIEPEHRGTPINTAYITGGNNTLRPEVASSLPPASDISRLSDALFSATYFRLDYRDRICCPAGRRARITRSTKQLDTLAAIHQFEPSTGDIQAVYDR